MAQCGICATAIDENGLCAACERARLSCRVCGHEFSYRDIVEDLPVVQCPTCESRAVEVSE